jgi:hypothetical protein
MSFDLFFVHKSVTPDQLKAKSFEASPEQREARKTIIAELNQLIPDAVYHGDEDSGHVENFPGEIHFGPKEISWSMGFNFDESKVQAIVDWFYAREMICEDPQDAGFSNREPKNYRNLESYDELINARLLSIAPSQAWGPTSLLLEFEMVDKNVALIEILHHERLDSSHPGQHGSTVSRVEVLEEPSGIFNDVLRTNEDGTSTMTKTEFTRYILKVSFQDGSGLEVFDAMFKSARVYPPKSADSI